MHAFSFTCALRDIGTCLMEAVCQHGQYPLFLKVHPDEAALVTVDNKVRHHGSRVLDDIGQSYYIAIFQMPESIISILPAILVIFSGKIHATKMLIPHGARNVTPSGVNWSLRGAGGGGGKWQHLNDIYL
eukprot:scaffold130983_cov37-Prasinocladus_malaysianus.AAC.1